MSAKVSVITPTYNHERFIGDCIESVLKQSYDDFEMIIVDDGSDDGTADVVRGYSDGRVNLISQRNRGIWNLAETYNRALAESEGEYVAILEGDDTWPTNKLEVQVPRMERESVIISCGRWLRMNTEGEVPKLARLYTWISMILAKSERAAGLDVMDEFLRNGNSIQPVTAMIQREALTAIGGFQQPDYAPYVDYPTFLELFKQGDLLRIPRVLGYHRHHSEQVTRQKIDQITSVANRYALDFYDSLPSNKRVKLDVSRDELAKNSEGTPDQRIGVGRIQLLEGEWEKARRSFRTGVNNGSTYFRLVSLIGLVHAYLRTDMEWLAKATNRRWFASSGDNVDT